RADRNAQWPLAVHILEVKLIHDPAAVDLAAFGALREGRRLPPEHDLAGNGFCASAVEAAGFERDESLDESRRVEQHRAALARVGDRLEHGDGTVDQNLG